MLSTIQKTTEAQFDKLIERYQLKIDAPPYNLRDANLVERARK